MNIQEKAYLELNKFKSLMNTGVSYEKAKYIWGKNFVKNNEIDFSKELINDQTIQKTNFAKEHLKDLLVNDWVRFIGISGSVAAGFAEEDDDIDIFVVVKNNTAWMYRARLVLRNIFHHRIRTKRDGKNVRDKFCINLICEEKDLLFENDIFNFHELMYLIPVYNEKYLNYIYSENPWLKSEYEVKNELMIHKVVVSKRNNIFLKIFNSLAFLFQLIFMVIAKHSPEISRLKANFKRGRIEFFPRDYKEKKINKYLS